MDHRVLALSIADIVKYWNEETNCDHEFEILYAIHTETLKFIDPHLDSEGIRTEAEARDFISRNKKYGIHYFPSGGEFIGKTTHYTAILEVVLYGGPKTVDAADLIVTLRHLCIKKEEFHRWTQARGKILPKFWFPEADQISVSPDASGEDPSFSEASDAPADLSKRERESLQKQVAALALVLAEKSAKYKNGDKPNGNQIAEAVALMLEAMPDANTYGVSSASLRSSIKAGVAMLQGKREEVE
jgi:hypothetical protein